jgi:hypothetical protein
MDENRAALLAEADRRGLLTGDKKALYDEAKKRNLISGAAATPEPPPAAAQSSGIGDFFKSIPRGAVEGFMSAASSGGKAAAIEMGQDPSQIPGTTESTGIIEKNVTGEMHKPEGTAGKFGAAVGEVLGNPASYIGPGSLPAKVVTGTASALGGEAAGQLTAGSKFETPARIAGSIVGGKAPAAAARAVTPIPATAERIAAAQTLANEGITAATAGQRTGSKSLQYAESHLGDAPGAGGRATEAMETVNRQFTAAVLTRAGIVADRATPDVIDGAFNRIGGEMDAIAARNNGRQDTQFLNDLITARDEYHATVQQGSRRGVVDDTIRDFFNRLTQSPVLTGDQYQRFRSRLTRLQRGAGNDPEYSQVLGSYVEAMDDMMARSITNPQDLQAWQQARRQYRNLIPISRAAAGAGEAAAEGTITPVKLRSVIASTQRGQREYSRGQGDFAELTRAGNILLTPLPNSGTGQRELARFITSSAGAALGGAASGGTGAGVGAAAGAAMPTLAGRAIMSPLAQMYFGNQVAPNLPAALPAPALRSALTSPLAEGGGP